MLEYIPVAFLKLIYPLKEPNHIRDRPLQVLCLGLGRTGTDSLRNALFELGYNDVNHGFRTASYGIGESVQWYRLALAKFKNNDKAFLNADEFDKVIGDCEALADLPNAAFGVELLRAYPEAKVILNQRTDVESWYQSQLKTIDTLNADWPSWSIQWFESESFWLGRIIDWTARRLSDWDFKRNGMELYKNHYAALKEECKAQDRAYLNWTVEDGWEPLCKFLNKQVPKTSFPNENDKSKFVRKTAEVQVQRMARARRNMLIVGVVLSVAIAMAAARYMFAFHL